MQGLRRPSRCTSTRKLLDIVNNDSLWENEIISNSLKVVKIWESDTRIFLVFRKDSTVDSAKS